MKKNFKNIKFFQILLNKSKHGMQKEIYIYIYKDTKIKKLSI